MCCQSTDASQSQGWILQGGYVINPRTLTLGDFHACDCDHVIFIVLLLSVLCGSLGSFILPKDITEGNCVSLLPYLFFQQAGVRVILVFEGKIFFGWILAEVSVFCINYHANK